MKLESLALHHGYKSDPTTKAAAVPIYQTTSYTFDDTQHGADLFDLKVAGNIYTRIMNPTTAVLERRLAEMEGALAHWLSLRAWPPLPMPFSASPAAAITSSAPASCTAAPTTCLPIPSHARE